MNSRLASALDVRSGELIAFVGAGGKTTAAWRLLGELSGAGERVIFTTTTRIFRPKEGVFPVVVAPSPGPDEVVQWLRASPALVLGASSLRLDEQTRADRGPYPAAPAKLAGPAPEALDALSRRLPDVTWLVEADGAKGRLLKAPAAYEPVIPAEADRVVVVAGLAAIGEPLDGDTVHRPEVAARLLGVPVGATVTPGLFARLVGHSSGGLNGIPGGADVVVLLAQWDNGPRDACVEAVAQRLVARRRVRRVVWADLEALDPVMGLWADG